MGGEEFKVKRVTKKKVWFQDIQCLANRCLSRHGRTAPAIRGSHPYQIGKLTVPDWTHDKGSEAGKGLTGALF
jgi:hypothetical protein